MLKDQSLFWELYNSKDEEDIFQIIQKHPEIFANSNWKALGQNESNYGIVKNQQSNPIAAIIEKVTNSIDAILTKKCKETGINPESSEAPQSMDEAIARFFPKNNWDVTSFRKQQSEDIQVIADGKGPRNQKNQFPTSVIIYDNGEGQHPADFENTFLSLIKGNKNKIQFVQGKYNMGGSGAIVFCGKRRYQLIASKKYDNSGDFGFTLIREHPKQESDQAKETWYEYLLIDGKIPSFPITQLDLGLHNRQFTTGSIIKMYSYQFPKGYSGFAQDLRQSINEFLFEPALPILTKDTKERYPNNNVLDADLFGLKRRLTIEDTDYIETKFSEDLSDATIGNFKVSCFVFKTKVKEYDVKKTRENIDDRYFKNGMTVLFSMNGQVHGHYTSEFISRSLKMNLLKGYLLIHVDCTHMNYDFRKELFMASRDRLKDGEETQYLRQYIANKLSASDGRLQDILKLRKQAVEIDASSNTEDLLRNYTNNMAFDPELMKLLGETFKLNIQKPQPEKPHSKDKPGKEKEHVPFHPNRFPTLFHLSAKNDGETEVSRIPKGGEKSIRFNTDVDDDYFDRIDEPGELQISVLNIRRNETDGGTAPGAGTDIGTVFNVNKSSPNKGTIRLNLNPTENLNVGDSVQLKVTLTAPGNDLEELFWVKVVEEQPENKEKAPKPENNEPLGLPQMVFAYEQLPEEQQAAVSWENLSTLGIDINHQVTMIPEVEGNDQLTKIYINMDSTVLKKFKGKYRNPSADQLEVANRKYYSSVYFHTLFLYTITKKRGYEVQKKRESNEQLESVDIGQYLKDLFDSHYSTFILHFGGTEELMQGLGE